MTDLKRNKEGYVDPTAAKALGRITKAEPRYRPLVYICSPFAGDVAQNVLNARKYARFAVMRGVIPVVPHLLYPQILDDENPAERELGLFFGLVLLTKCRELWVFGATISRGMEAEINKAKALRHPIAIRYFNGNCTEITRNTIEGEGHS